MAKKVILICEMCLSRNYDAKVNEATLERLCLKKHCATCNKHTIHKETR